MHAMHAVRMAGIQPDAFFCERCFTLGIFYRGYHWRSYHYRCFWPTFIEDGVPLNSLLVSNENDDHVCDHCGDAFHMDAPIFRMGAERDAEQARREANATAIDADESDEADGSCESEADRVTRCIEIIRNSPFASVLTTTEACVFEELERRRNRNSQVVATDHV